MADVDTSMPIKTEIDTHEYVRVKVYDTTATFPLNIDSSGDAIVKAKLRDNNGNEFGTESNPVFTVIGEDPADEIESYQSTASVAKGASVDHDYTVTAAKTFKGLTLFVSAAGEFKYELKKETAVASGIYTTLYVGFKQASNPQVQMDLKKTFKQVAGAKVRITITNRDNTTDLYSTLVGVEV